MEMVEELKKTLEEHKIEDVAIVSLKNINPYADYYLLGTAMNERQLSSMEEYIEETLIKNGGELKRKDGNGESGWIVYDCGETIIHLFLANIRNEINLEGLIEKTKEKLKLK